MKSIPLTVADPLYSSAYIMFEDGRVMNTNTGKYIKMDEHNRISVPHANYSRPVHRSIRPLYKALFGRCYHGTDNTIDLPNEQWIEVEGSKGAYYISSYGRVKSYIKHSNPQILTPRAKVKDSPYLSVDLSIDGVIYSFLVHRLVAKHFLPDTYSEDKEVHHKDGNALNNKVDNLLCLTREEHIKIHSRSDNNDTL